MAIAAESHALNSIVSHIDVRVSAKRRERHAQSNAQCVAETNRGRGLFQPFREPRILSSNSQIREGKCDRALSVGQYVSILDDRIR